MRERESIFSRTTNAKSTLDFRGTVFWGQILKGEVVLVLVRSCCRDKLKRACE